MARLILATILLGLFGLSAEPLRVEAVRHEVSGKGRIDIGEGYYRFEFDGRGGPSEATGTFRLLEGYHGNRARSTSAGYPA